MFQLYIHKVRATEWEIPDGQLSSEAIIATPGDQPDLDKQSPQERVAPTARPG